jgi:hypothetical protein
MLAEVVGIKIGKCGVRREQSADDQGARQIRSGRLGGLLPEAPTDPDMQVSRIRLFGRRFRYVTVGRMRGCGSGYRASSRSMPTKISTPAGSGDLANSATHRRRGVGS